LGWVSVAVVAAAIHAHDEGPVKLTERAMADLRAQVGELLDGIRPVITTINAYKWEGESEPHFWEFLRRATLQRQVEAMDAICAMSDAGHGHFGVTLLRPAFEELVWIEFLSKNIEVARILIPELARLEVAKSIRAQFLFGGIQSLRVLGFDKKMLITLLRVQPMVQARIKEALLKLGWKHHKQLLPTMKFLAKSVGRGKDYDYIYHGTSRFVHFSTQELLRRVWGKHGEVYVSTESFSQFWTDFALYWGIWILLYLLIACDDLMPGSDSLAGKDLDLYKERFTNVLRALKRVPIVTAEELESWGIPVAAADAPSTPQV
jgi:hypothetical protein